VGTELSARSWLLAVAVGLMACGGLIARRGTEPVVSEGAAMRTTYGDDRNQFGDLTLPAASTAGPVPVVVLIHGGFWRTGFGSELMEPLVPSLVEAGYAVWNIEYRRVGSGPEGGGGFPQTFDDVAAAVDQLVPLSDQAGGRLDLTRVATVGHSAGGHLAAWLVSRPSLPADSPWADPAVVPVLAVSQAGVLDLERCVAEGVGGTACRDLLGPGVGLEDRIAAASPAALLPVDARVVAVHGSADSVVPPDQSARYVADALDAGSTAELRVIDGADHFDVIDPTHEAWLTVLDALADESGSA